MLRSSMGPSTNRLRGGRLRAIAPTAIVLRGFLIGRIAGLVGVVALLALIAVPTAQAQAGSTTTISAAVGVQFSGAVDSSPECSSAPTSVTINWGDGTSSAGTYDPTNNDVTGTHTYTTQGTLTGGSVSFSGGTDCETDTLTANVGPAPLFTQCPPVDADFGCQFLIVVSSSGTTILQDTNQGPYETSDDALIGIENNSADPISAIPLSTPGSDLFGFDGDGICDPGEPPIPVHCVPAPGSPAGTTCNGSLTPPCSFPAPPGEPAGYTEPGAPTGSTQNGYEGPSTWYSNVTPDQTTGQVNFSPALQPGQSTFFSLEEPPSLAALAVGSTPQGATFSAPPTVTSTGASFSGLVNPNGSATTAYFQYGLDARYSTLGASGPVYDHSTPVQSVGADFASHSVLASVSGLVPNALYHVQLVASNKSGTTFGPDQTFMTKQGPPPPPPTLGKTFNVKPVSGLVLIKLPAGKAADLTAAATLTKGQGFIPLTEARQLPTGTQVDSRSGTLQLVAASSSHGKTQTGIFGGAIFGIAQDRTGLTKGLTVLSLLEGAFPGAPTYASCPKAAPDDATARAARLSPKVLQALHATDNRGKFGTKGRYSSATVRGTVWTTIDRCDGTLTSVQRGTVLVTVFATRKTITLHAGQSFLASAITKKRR
ncbi:MAG: hypothetical protein ACLP0J_22400 [Solirubrobacteraceae bacterium]